MPDDTVNNLSNDLQQLDRIVEKLTQTIQVSSSGFDLMKDAQQKALSAVYKYNKAQETFQKSLKSSSRVQDIAQTQLSKAETTMEKSSKQLLAYKNAQDQVNKTMAKSNGFISRMNAARSDALDSIKKYNDAQKDGSKATKALQKKMNDAIDEYKSFKGANDSLNSALKDNQSVMGLVGSAMKSTAGIAKGLFGTLGLGAVSFQQIYDITRQYNQTIIDLGSSLAVVGRDFESWESAIASLRDETVLSEQTFASLAKQMTEGMIGSAPDPKEWVDFSKTLGRQVGWSSDKLSEWGDRLLKVQNMSDETFQEMRKGLKLREKVDRGDATAEEEKYLNILKEGMQIRLQVIGLSETEAKKTASVLEQRDAKTREAIETERKLAQAQKDFKDAMLELSKVATPLLEKMAEGLSWVLEKAQEMPKTFGAIVTSIAGFKIASPILTGLAKNLLLMHINGQDAIKSLRKLGTLSAKLGKGGLVAGVFTASAIAVGTLVKRIHEANEASKEFKKTSKNLASQQEEMMEKFGTADPDVLSDIRQAIQNNNKEQIEHYTKEYPKAVKVAKKTVTELVEAEKKPLTSAQLLKQEFNRVAQSVETNLGILKQISDPLETQIQLAEEFANINRTALKQNLEMAKMQTQEQERAVKAAAKVAASMVGVEINLEEGNVLDQARSLQKILMERLSTLQEAEAEEQKILQVRDALNNLQTSLVDQEQSRLNVISKIFDVSLAEMNLMEQHNSAYEQRLNVQRQLMESAQFGLGASVEMMQKQVDLAHEMMSYYQASDDQLAKDLVNKGQVADIQKIQVMRQAKSVMQAEQLAKQIADSAEEEKALTGYAKKHQEVTTKTMQQQQKIYELTKQVREGYLDAIREMSVGAGEFSKIIGTQEMGVTQLMSAVQGVTKEARLNTMALGGLQEKVLTSAGVGTKVGYRYTTSGLQKGISAEEERGRLGRIWNYTESVNKARRGQVERKGGSAVAAGKRDIEALKEGSSEGAYQGTYEGSYKGNYNALNDFYQKAKQGVGVTARTSGGQLPGKRDTSKPLTHAGTMTRWNWDIAKKSEGQVADPTGGPTLGGKININELEQINITKITLQQQKQLIKTYKELENKLKNNINETKKGTDTYESFRKQMEKVQENRSELETAIQTGQNISEYSRDIPGGRFYYGYKGRGSKKGAEETEEGSIDGHSFPSPQEIEMAASKGAEETKGVAVDGYVFPSPQEIEMAASKGAEETKGVSVDGHVFPSPQEIEKVASKRSDLDYVALGGEDTLASLAKIHKMLFEIKSTLEDGLRIQAS